MIKITDDLRINNDSNSWTVEERKVVKDKESKNYGNVSWNPVSHHSRLTKAFESVLDKQMKEITKTSIKEFLTEAKQIQNTLKSILEAFTD